MRLFAFLMATFLSTGCVSLQQQQKIKNVEQCVLRMIYADVPADIAADICEKMYENIHRKHREKQK